MSDERNTSAWIPSPEFIEGGKYQLELESSRREARKQELEEKKSELETLKFMHAASLARWKDRRDNEWKLNYAIWAAIAGLAALLLHERSTLSVPNELVVVGIIACIALHLAYLWPTIERAICEIELQSDVEHALHKLLGKDAQKEIPKEHLGGAIRRYEKPQSAKWWERPRSWLWKRYGLVAPLCLTAALLVLCGLLVTGHNDTEPNKKEAKSKTVQPAIKAKN